MKVQDHRDHSYLIHYGWIDIIYIVQKWLKFKFWQNHFSRLISIKWFYWGWKFFMDMDKKLRKLSPKVKHRFALYMYQLPGEGTGENFQPFSNTHLKYESWSILQILLRAWTGVSKKLQRTRLSSQMNRLFLRLFFWLLRELLKNGLLVSETGQWYTLNWVYFLVTV